MTNHAVRKVLEMAQKPETLSEVGERLSAISDAMLSLRDQGRRTPALGRDHDGLLDLWVFSDLALAKHILPTQDNHPLRRTLTLSQDQDEAYPHTDPVRMLSLAQKYAVLPKDEVQSLKGEFMARASAAAGHDLTQAQVKKLYTLFRTYNPLGHMAPK